MSKKVKKNRRAKKINFFKDGVAEEGSWLGSIKVGGEWEIGNLGNNGSSSVSVSLVHERNNPNKPFKEIVWIPPLDGKEGNCAFPPIDTALQYDQIFAIDTNYKELDGFFYCVTGALQIKDKDTLSSENTVIEVAPPQTYSSDIRPKPENIAWQNLIKYLQGNFKDQSILVVVDSDRDNLQDYNLRKKPYCGNEYLPENFKFGYASADKNDTVFNRMIKECDERASVKMNDLVSKKDGIKIK